MKKVIIYGLGKSSRHYLNDIEEKWEIVAVSDSYKNFDSWMGYSFVDPSEIQYHDWDYIVVPSSVYYSEIKTYLQGIGIEASRIIKGWYKKLLNYHIGKKF